MRRTPSFDNGAARRRHAATIRRDAVITNPQTTRVFTIRIDNWGVSTIQMTQDTTILEIECGCHRTSGYLLLNADMRGPAVDRTVNFPSGMVYTICSNDLTTINVACPCGQFTSSTYYFEVDEGQVRFSLTKG